MEGKAVLLSVLIMSLVMAQIQLGAAKVCCSSTTAQDKYHNCYFTGGPWDICAKFYGCKIIDEGRDCPKDYPFGSFVHSVDLANGYCKLGCVSSVCGPINTLQKSDASEIVNGAVAQCTKACASLCTKEFITA